MEKKPAEVEEHEKTYIDDPAILEKHKASAAVVDGK